MQWQLNVVQMNVRFSALYKNVIIPEATEIYLNCYEWTRLSNLEG